MLGPDHVGSSVSTVTSRSGSLASFGEPVVFFQLAVLWQPPQSELPVGGCVKLGTGSEANGPPTSWHVAHSPSMTPLWSYIFLSPAGWQVMQVSGPQEKSA